MTIRPPSESSLPPPLKWAGGKRWLLPRLRRLWREHGEQRLVEPFCGGLAVSLGLQPRRSLLNDVNPHPVNFYRCLQSGFTARLKMVNDKALYYEHRRTFNDLVARRGPHGKKAAALFYYLNRTGYNGLCRFNRKGEFNVPFGRHRTINYRKDFKPYADTLADWQFTETDFAALTLGSGDFIYADPPYDVEFRQYSRFGFDWSEQERLAEWLSDHAGPVVASNQATDRVVDLYRRLGFSLRFVPAPRSISRDGNREPAIEVLALRNLCPDTIPDTFASARAAARAVIERRRKP